MNHTLRMPSSASSEKLVANLDGLAAIHPFSYDDPETGDRVRVSVSPSYSMITVNYRTYYFNRETGDFDGAATEFHTGPVLVTASE